MNRKIGIYSSVMNIAAVSGFALSMLIGTNFGSYFTSMFIAFSFVPMMCAFNSYGKTEHKAAGYTSMIFAGAYMVFILIVYFAQVTSVRLDGLQKEALQIIDYQYFGLFFNYDLLGYGLMALSTFFAGFTVDVKSKSDKWLKALLQIHGIFFISCLVIPMLGMFSADMEGSDWIGTMALEFWCIYFIPVGILSLMYFLNKSKE